VADLETRLQRAFAADAPPATDALFRVHVMLRQERAALRRQLAEALGLACVCSLLTVLVLQALDEILESTAVRLLVTAVLVLGYVAVFALRYLGVPPFPSCVYLLRSWLNSVTEWR